MQAKNKLAVAFFFERRIDETMFIVHIKYEIKYSWQCLFDIVPLPFEEYRIGFTTTQGTIIKFVDVTSSLSPSKRMKKKTVRMNNENGEWLKFDSHEFDIIFFFLVIRWIWIILVHRQ